jgi:hypothetical protein
MVEDLIKRLKEAAQAATPQNLDTAQQVERFEDGSHITCPTCGGEGYAELNSDFCNYDGKAIGVQFYGIGPEHSAAEAYFRAASPAAILELIAMIEQQVARLTALESERDALLAAAGKEAVKGEPVAWLIDWPDEPDLGHYFGEEPNEFARSVPLYTAPTAALEKPSDALYTMDQMRDYALAFHKSRLDAHGDLTAKQKWDIAERVHSQCEAPKPHATFRSAASQAINDTIAALSQKEGEQQ